MALPEEEPHMTSFIWSINWQRWYFGLDWRFFEKEVIVSDGYIIEQPTFGLFIGPLLFRWFW